MRGACAQPPDRNGRTLVLKNMNAVREASERNRRELVRRKPLVKHLKPEPEPSSRVAQRRPRAAPRRASLLSARSGRQTDAALARAVGGILAPARARALAGWLASASAEDKAALRDVAAGIANDSELARTPIARGRAAGGAGAGAGAGSAGDTQAAGGAGGQEILRTKIKERLRDPAARAGLRDAVGAAAAAQGSGGRLDAERLVALLGAAGVVLTAEEDAALRTMLGCDGAGSVGADAFEAELVPPEPPAPPAPRLRRPDSAGAGGAPVALLECSDDALLELVQARPRRPGSSAARRS